MRKFVLVLLCALLGVSAIAQTAAAGSSASSSRTSATPAQKAAKKAKTKKAKAKARARELAKLRKATRRPGTATPAKSKAKAPAAATAPAAEAPAAQAPAATDPPTSTSTDTTVGGTVTAEATPPPGAVMSDSLEYIGKIPDTTAVIAGQFDKVDGKDILLIDGSWGLKIFDVTDPANPKPLGTWQAPGYTRFWEGEDMDIDLERNLVFMSVDPRHGQSVWENGPNGQCRATPGNGNTTAPGCTSGIFVVSYANPAQPVTIGDFIELPSGHTTTCIDHCNFLWTGGPARRSDLDWLGPRTPGGRGDGRPVWVTDMRNPNKPEVFGAPVDLYRNDGVTDYSHDVQVDAEGIAWVSGRGGIRGYATSGRYRDPMSNTTRLARPWDPILVAGGGVAGVASPDVIFMHNSLRPTDKQIHARGVKDGNILFGTEEQFNNSCANDGKLVISDLTDSWGGEPGLNSTPAAPYRMKAISTWHPAIDTPETAATTNDCSAHYFDIKEATLAMAFYSQGTRILDVLNAQFPRQIGYYRVQSDGSAGNPSSTVWATKFFGKDLLYVFDNRRGVEILKLKFPTGVPDDEDTVVAPNAKADPYAATAVFQGSYVCPLFEDSPAAYEAGLALSS